MKIFSKVTIFLFSNILTSNCFGMDKSQDFQTQLKKFLTDQYQLSPGKYKDFFAKYEKTIVEKILNGEIDPDKPIYIKDDYGRQPYASWLIYRVVQVGNLEILKAIIKKSPKMLNFTEDFGNPLLFACRNKDVACIKYLLEQRADPMKMFIPPLKNFPYAIHPMSYLLGGMFTTEDVTKTIKILDLIAQNCTKFLTHNFYDKTCLSEVEQFISANSEDPKLIDTIIYWTEIQKFIKSKTRLRRFAPKEE